MAQNYNCETETEFKKYRNPYGRKVLRVQRYPQKAMLVSIVCWNRITYCSTDDAAIYASIKDAPPKMCQAENEPMRASFSETVGLLVESVLFVPM
jgi:hypothetical protein